MITESSGQVPIMTPNSFTRILGGGTRAEAGRVNGEGGGWGSFSSGSVPRLTSITASPTVDPATDERSMIQWVMAYASDSRWFEQRNGYGLYSSD